MKNRTLVKKAVIILLLVLVIVIFNYFHLNRFLSLSYLKQSQQQFMSIYSRHKILTILVYMIIYITVTTLSIPGAAALTLAGGALFGFWVGTIAVSFASTIGATLACFVSRFLLRDWVQKRYGDKLSLINQGIWKEGAFYLFTLRLIPVFPFFIINLGMGVTPLPLLKFYWVSQLGMLPGTMVYVNAGKELGEINSLSGILSPRLILAFVLLGVFPITVKKLLGFYKRERNKP